MAYILEGRLVEVCTCKAICPCWVGEDPDFGYCDGVLAWHFDKGKIDNIDVSGLNFALLCHIPGNILHGEWRVSAYIDEMASVEQEQAILAVYTGKKGGPVAELAQMVGEVVSMERVPFIFEVLQAKGQLRIGQAVNADIEPFKGLNNQPTTLADAMFSTIPGSPSYVGKAPIYQANAPVLGINIDLQNHHAIQGSFRFAS